jgi:hypothetical protein
MSENKTLIVNLKQSKFEEEVNIGVDLDKNTLSQLIIDLTISLTSRIKALELFYTSFGQEESLELINRLSTMYQFSGTKVLEKYLYEICMNSNISSLLKITIAKSICYFDKEKEIGYQILDYVCQNMSDVATPCQIEAVCLLMVHKDYKTQSKKYFCNIINNETLDCDYRYKTILSLENKDIPDYLDFLSNAALEFFYKKTNRTFYRILAGQVLMQKSKQFNLESTDNSNIPSGTLFITSGTLSIPSGTLSIPSGTLSIPSGTLSIENTLLEFSQDVDLDYNLRADAADVILRLGSDANKVLARELIMILGRQNEVKTIFENAQNVHVTEIEESVMEVLEFLSSIEMKTISGIPGSPVINYDYIKKEIDEMMKNKAPPKKEVKNELEKDPKTEPEPEDDPDLKEYNEKLDKINISMNRIYLDRALYSNYNCTLLHILLKVWTYLTSHECEKDMRQRLLEELVDMSGTCSTGFAGRLINVICGFGKFNLRISWRDQIVANFNGRLNARARDITKYDDNVKFYGLKKCKKYTNKCVDRVPEELSSEECQELLEDFQEKVLEEMSINTNDYEYRLNFLLFFRKNLLSIRQELYEEFKDYMDDTSYDLYCRSAISIYETGGYV